MPDGVTPGTTSQTTININDPDTPAVQVNFGATTYTATEGTTAQVTVQLDKAPKRSVTIPLTTAFQGGATAADFGTLPTSVTFASNATSATVSFAVTDDGVSDPNESIQLSIGTTLPAQVSAGTTTKPRSTSPTPAYSNSRCGSLQIQPLLLREQPLMWGSHSALTPDRILVIPFTVTFQGGQPKTT